MSMVIIMVFVMCLDNVIMGFAYGLRKIDIPLRSNALIAAINAFGTFSAILAGTLVSGLFRPQLAKTIGCSMFILMGVLVIIQEGTRKLSDTTGLDGESLLKKIGLVFHNPLNADADGSGSIDFREAILLGIALTLNNLPFGISAGLAGISPGLVAGLTIAVSLFTIWLGVRIARTLANTLSFTRFATLASGFLLIVVGVFDMLN